MSPDTAEKLAKVRKYSASLRKLFRFFLVIAVIGMIVSTLILFLTDADNTTLAIWDLRFAGDEITPTIRVLGGIYLLLIFAIMVKLLYHLAALFGLYAEGLIFMANDVAQIRQIGISVFLFCAAWLYVILAKLILLALGHPVPAYEPSQRTIGLEIGAGNLPLLALLAGIIIIVISWIMDVGREMREEQDLTV